MVFTGEVMKGLALVSWLWLAAVSSPYSVAAVQKVDASAPIVFVCEHGAVKSVVAAALFNKLAAERGVPLRAISRGTDPDPAIPAPVRDGMSAEGLTVDPMFRPTRLTSGDVQSARHVVVFDVAIPKGDRVERWDNLPAFSAGYGPASAAVRAQVERLLRQLSTK
jgi:arsenate reductase (thioredoxin)